MNEAADNTAATSYRPGTWFGVLGDHAAVFLPPSVKERVAPLWELVDGGAGFDELLDALIAGGLRTLPGFLILSRGEEATRVLVRGTPRAVLQTATGETVEVDGADTTTWTERSVAGVIQTTLLLEGAEVGWTEEPGHQHLVVGGLVRVARVDHPPYLAVPAAPAVPVAPVPSEEWAPPTGTPAYADAPASDALGPIDPTPVEVVEDGIGDLVDDGVDDGVEDEAFAVVTSEPEPELEAESESTMAFEAFVETPDEAPAVDALSAPAVDSWPAPAPSAAPPAPLSVGAWHSPDTEEPFAPPPAAAEQAPAAAEQAPFDHDGQTLGSSWESSQFARQQPGIPGQPPAPSVTARPVARLHFAHGEVIDVDRAVLVGRAPEARRFTSTDQPRLVTVPSPNQEISSTHLEIRPGSGADHATAVVTDLGSTNGTVLVLPGLGPQSLQPGVSVQLLPGALIDLGDGMTVQVSGV